MIFNNFYPFLPPHCDKPPTLYSVLNSIVNGDKDEDDYTKIKDLAKQGRSKIFDFDYPLSNAITKEFFECMILNHYMTRRIGFETVTNFKLHLQVKINSIMPKYNILFDNQANIMNSRTITKDGSTTSSNTSSNENNSSSETDNRFSDEPQNEIQDVKDGKYVSTYSLTKADVESSGNATNEGNGTYHEIITENDNDNTYFRIQSEMIPIFDLIFKELDSLFFTIV